MKNKLLFNPKDHLQLSNLLLYVSKNQNKLKLLLNKNTKNKTKMINDFYNSYLNIIHSNIKN